MGPFGLQGPPDEIAVMSDAVAVLYLDEQVQQVAERYVAPDPKLTAQCTSGWP
jgi:hypothetical protein